MSFLRNSVNLLTTSLLSLSSDVTPGHHLIHHHCHHPSLLLSPTPGSKLIFSTNPFLHRSSTFPPTGTDSTDFSRFFLFSRVCRCLTLVLCAKLASSQLSSAHHHHRHYHHHHYPNHHLSIDYYTIRHIIALPDTFRRRMRKTPCTVLQE